MIQVSPHTLLLPDGSLASQTFTRKTGRSGDISIPVAVPVERTECNFLLRHNHNFVCALVRGTNVLQRHGLKQNCLASILTLNK